MHRGRSALLFLAPLLAPVLLLAPPNAAAGAMARQAESANRDLETTTFVVPSVLRRRGDFANELPAALRTMSGADVQWLSNPPSVVVRGTREEIDRARSALLGLIQQAESQARDAEQAAQAAQPAESVEDRLFDLDFPGGTLAEFVALLRVAAGTDNILVADEKLHARPVPPIRLSRVGVDTAVRTLQMVTSFHGSGQPELSASANQRRPNETAVWTIWETARPAAPPTPPPPPPSYGVYNVRAIAQNQAKFAALLEAIGVGVELIGEGKAPNTFTIKFHQPTGLLFVRGTKFEIAMAEEVIEKMSAAE